jgi:redox-sensitive bicupin YhaK (pirin superfamily)
MSQATPPLIQHIPAHEATVGGIPIRRALPSARCRMVGAWCFLDHAGPATQAPEQRMRVAPHPHTGLQTFSWMMEGEILHRDSVGSQQVLRPGEVNLMTAGRGIAHSEESLSDRVHLAQLWIALPDAERFREPGFEHHAVLPQIEREGFTLTVLAGSFEGTQAPPRVYSPLLGLEAKSSGPACASLALDTGFEHGVMVLEGEAELSIAGVDELQTLQPGSLLYIGAGPTSLQLRSDAACRLLLLGGEPWPVPALLWWNFVGREPEEIQQFAQDWNAGGQGFGQVVGYEGEPLRAPDASGLRLKRPG